MVEVNKGSAQQDPEGVGSTTQADSVLDVDTGGGAAGNASVSAFIEDQRVVPVSGVPIPEIEITATGVEAEKNSSPAAQRAQEYIEQVKAQDTEGVHPLPREWRKLGDDVVPHIISAIENEELTDLQRAKLITTFRRIESNSDIDVSEQIEKFILDRWKGADPKSLEREAAERALGFMESDLLRDEIIDMSQSTDRQEELKHSLSAIVFFRGDEELFAILEEAHRDPELFLYADHAMTEYGYDQPEARKPAIVQNLIDNLSHPDWRTRWSAIDSLEKYGLDGDSPEIRRARLELYILAQTDEEYGRYVAKPLSAGLNDPEIRGQLREDIERSTVLSDYQRQEYLNHLQNVEIAMNELDIEYPFRMSPESLQDVVQNRLSNEPDGRPLAVVVVSKDDSNNAFYHMQAVEELQQQGYRVMYYEAGNEDQVEQALLGATHLGEPNCEQRADIIVLAGHGEFDAITLSESGEQYDEERLLDKDDEEELHDSGIGDTLADDGQVLLISCDTGNGRAFKDNIANLFRRLFPQASSIFSPTAPATSPDLEFGSDRRIIEVDFKDTKGVDVPTYIS